MAKEECGKELKDRVDINALNPLLEIKMHKEA
jgi:hypothetical protein